MTPRERRVLRILAAIIVAGCAFGLLMCAVAAVCAWLGV